MAGRCGLMLILVALSSIATSASPQHQPRQAPACNDACYSAIATYNSATPYAGNGICYSWLSSYPPAHTTRTFPGTQFLATVSHTTFSTRVETVYQLANNAAATSAVATSSAAATPAPTASSNEKRGFEVQRRQTTSAPASSATDGLPLPNSNIASSCSNDPVAFASACSCIGDSGQTAAAYTTVTIPSTTTVSTITRECTSTVTAPACVATASLGMRASALRFGDSGQPSGVNSTLWSNNTTASDCCNACFSSDQNCRFFTYAAPAGSIYEMADGGSCELNLEGDSCPRDVLPPNTFAYDYNYITEGMFEDTAENGTLFGFGPCAQEVPRFYGYQSGRAGVGICSADSATTTVFAS
ncbi:MAG: hypothetical protein Q9162_000875 [Coniocarpon cinnabarinum]